MGVLDIVFIFYETKPRIMKSLFVVMEVHYSISSRINIFIYASRETYIKKDRDFIQGDGVTGQAEMASHCQRADPPGILGKNSSL